MSKTYLPHQRRVIDEKIELDDRLSKLKVFLTSDLFDKLDIQNQELLELQSVHMQAYSNVLAERIVLF
jgi:hypothetical protein